MSTSRLLWTMRWGRRTRPARVVVAVAMVVVASLSPSAAGATTLPVETVTPGLSRLTAAAADITTPLLGVATFSGSGGPTAGQLDGLRSLGLEVQVLDNLDMAIVRGSLDQLTAAVRTGVASDIWPNEQLQYYSQESTAAIGADVARAQGVTGGGVGVAIVDSGVDATHPDLADHVTHNVKILGPEYANLPPGTPPGRIVVPVEDTPYSNTDLTTGHGTHVAGIVAADGHTSPEQVGVAPDADIISYAAGDGPTTVMVLAALEHVLEYQEAWGIDVVNNSWGGRFRPFDADDPINRATKALSDAGIVVVFAAGNGSEEMSLNAYAAAPWVIAVGSGTVAGERSPFSSGGLEYDNSTVSGAAADGHVRHDGDGPGLYHPDVSAPGSSISSSAAPTGVVVGPPGPPGGTRTLSGTSMAAPHVVGLAALLLQVRPDLTPEQVRQVLEATARPMSDGSPFWAAGYGFVDAEAALALVDRADFGSDLLDEWHRRATQRVGAEDGPRVVRSDLWNVATSVLTGVTSEAQRFTFEVAPGAESVKVVGDLPESGTPLAEDGEYRVSLLNSEGEVVARSTTPASPLAPVRLSADIGSDTAGETWTVVVEAIGVLSTAGPPAADGSPLPVTLGTLAAAQVASGTGHAAPTTPRCASRDSSAVPTGTSSSPARPAVTSTDAGSYPVVTGRASAFAQSW